MEKQAILDPIKAYKPLLDKLTVATKIEIYTKIYQNIEGATDEMLSLGLAITADPHFQSWMNGKLHLPKP